MVQMTAQEQLQAGLAHHRAGRLGEAEKIYREILSAHPKNGDALFLLGSLAHQAGKIDDAREFLNQAIAVNPNVPDYHLNLGVIMTSQGRLSEAVAAFQKSLSLRPQAPGFFNLGVALSQMNQLDPAITAFRQAVVLDPNHFLSYMMLGNALRETGRLEEAVTAYRQAALLNPNYPEVHNNLGGALAQLNRLKEAASSFRQAIALNPNLPEAHNNLGLALTSMNQLEESVASIKKALALRPNYAGAYNALGIALQKLGALDDALAAFRHALKLTPDHPEYLNNVGMVLGDLGQLEAALATLQHVVTLSPTNADYLYHLGVALEDLGRLEESLDVYRKAIALKPDHSNAHMSFGLLHSLLGDFHIGWQEFEWRANCLQIPLERNLTQPKWTGGDLQGKTLLLHWEQGLGDTLQFIRYAPILAARGAKIFFKCQRELESLLKDTDGIADIAADEKLLPPFQLQCPLVSIPTALCTTLDTIPAKIPYVTAPPDRVASWRDRIGTSDTRLRVGISWAGQPKHRNDRRRSMRLDQFAPLAELKSSRFFSLQKGSGSAQSASPPAGMDFTDWTADLHDFADTAALVANLDLIISVDTSIAHLAGAMGKPVWVLLPFVPDWRWMLNRTDSPWYPTMRLFRQPAHGDWPSVMADVSRALAQRCK
jgi:tetratricopeptide (TPR) repeat protein